MIMEEPIRLTPSLREKVWGKTHLEPWFRDSKSPIGEAWYLGGAGGLATGELPLLVKLGFTSEKLSIQVHPDDSEDGPSGKTYLTPAHTVHAGTNACFLRTYVPR